MPQSKTLSGTFRSGWLLSSMMVLGLVALAILPVSHSEARTSISEKQGAFTANAAFTLDAVSKAALPLADSVAGQSFISPTSVSADGRYVVYVSDALNVVPGQVDTNGGQDIFLFDRMTSTTQLVSRAVGMSTTTADAPSAGPSISADGQYIAFVSGATNLVAGQTDTNLSGDVFVFDRVAGTTQLVSRVAGTTTTTGDRGSDSPMISADGNFIAFRSLFTNLVTGQSDGNFDFDIFLFNRAAGTTQLVSRTAGSATTTGNFNSESPVISANGQYVAFMSVSTNLVTGQSDTNFGGDIFVFDRIAGTNQLVSRNAGSATTTGDGGSDFPVISGDGNFIAFRSTASNLVTGQTDTNFNLDIFVFDRVGGTTQLVSRAAGTTTTTGDAGSDTPVVSSTGQYIAYKSDSTNLVTGQTDTNFGSDVFVFDRTGGTTTLVSRVGSSSTATGDGASDTPGISSDGNFISFQSTATNLVTGVTDTNATNDVFVFNRTGGTSQLVSRDSGSSTTTANNFSLSPVISSDGNFIAFQSSATNLVAGSPDLSNFDVFEFNRGAGTSVLVSFHAAGLPNVTATDDSTLTTVNAISDDGRYVVFTSTATNLVPGQIDTNIAEDIFVHDRVAGTTQLVSRAAGTTTTAANFFSALPVISANGNYIAYQSRATNLVTGQTDTNNGTDIFLFDRVAGTTRLISGNGNSTTMTGSSLSSNPEISGDGNFITYLSFSTNLVTGQSDSNFNSDVFVFDRVGGTNQLVSRQVGMTTTTSDGGSALPTISGNGQYIAFHSSSTNLVTGQNDTNNNNDVFVFDRVGGTMQLVSGTSGSSTTTGNGQSEFSVISSDGGFITYRSLATDIITGLTDTNSTFDMFVFNRTGGTTQLVSRTGGSATTTANGFSFGPQITANGGYIVFQSTATDVVTGQTDTNSNTDIFVFDRVGGTNQLVSRTAGSATTTGDGVSDSPVISDSGQLIAFRSEATNLVAGQTDTNTMGDVFVFDRITPEMTLLSGASGSMTTTGNGASSTPAMNTNGVYIGFNSFSSNLIANDFNANSDVFLAAFPQPITATISGGGAICSGENATVTATITGGTPPYTVTLTNGGGTQMGSSPLMFTVSPGSDTTYAFDSGTDANGMPIVGSGSAQVTVTPVATVNAGPDQTVCTPNLPVTLAGMIGGSATTGTWSGGAGTFSPNATTLNATYTPTAGEIAAGTVTLTLTTSGSGGSCSVASDTVTITISVCATISGGGTICSGENATVTATITGGTPPYTVTLTNGGGTQMGSSPLMFTVSPGADTTYMFQSGMDANGRPITGSGSAQVTVTPVATVNAGPDQSVCTTDLPVTLAGMIGGSATTGTWSGGGGTFSPNATTLNATYTPTAGEIAAGTVTLTLTTSGSGGSCSVASDTVTITISVCATISGGGTLCDGGGGRNPVVMVTITGGTPPYTVTLTNGGGTQTGASPLLFNVSPASTTTYMFQSGMDSTGMPITAEGSAVVTVLTAGTSDAGPDQSVCESSGSVTLAGVIGGGATTGTWSGGAGTFSPNATTLNATYTPTAGELAAGTVTLTLTTSGGGGDCSVDSDTVTITFLDCDPASVLMVADTTNNRVQRFDGTAWSVIGVGTVGSGNGQFRLPEAVAFDTAGRIYVADTGNNRIQWSTDAGVTWADFATSGSATNQVQGPQGLTLDSSGNLYVSDTGNRRVMRFDGGVPGTGVVIASTGTAGGQVMSPRGLVMDDTFRLFVADEGNSKILRIPNANTVTTPASGSILAGAGTGLNKVQNPQGVAIGPTGTLYVADTGNSRILAWLNANPATGIALATTGTLLGKVNNAEGVVVKTFTAGPFAGTTLLVVSDTGNNRIQGKELPTGGWSLVGAPNNVGSGVGQFRAPSKIQ